MAKIVAPIDNLKTAAKEMRAIADKNRGLFDQVYNLTVGIKNMKDWNGKSVDALITSTASNKKVFKELIDELDMLSKDLKQYAEAMENQDNDIKKKVDSI